MNSRQSRIWFISKGGQTLCCPSGIGEYFSFLVSSEQTRIKCMSQAKRRHWWGMEELTQLLVQELVFSRQALRLKQWPKDKHTSSALIFWVRRDEGWTKVSCWRKNKNGTNVWVLVLKSLLLTLFSNSTLLFEWDKLNDLGSFFSRDK